MYICETGGPVTPVKRKHYHRIESGCLFLINILHVGTLDNRIRNVDSKPILSEFFRLVRECSERYREPSGFLRRDPMLVR